MRKLSRFSNQINNFRKNFFEKEAWLKNQVVCGIDEVGRGCMAGPLVTAAVILPVGKAPRFLKDSKIMTPEERVHAYNWIVKHCYYGYGIVNHRSIDKNNIWYATLIAMKKALVHLLETSPVQPHAILIDAMPLELLDTSFSSIPVHYFPFGESKSSSIAAASIIAKVTRDSMMEKFDALFPGYNFKSHKGYRTPEHKKFIKTISSSMIHRKTYVKRFEERTTFYELQRTILDEQQTINDATVIIEQSVNQSYIEHNHE